MVFGFLRAPERRSAVRNALLAKATMSTLDTRTLAAIEVRAKEIYAGGGRTAAATPQALAKVTLEGMTEFERLSLSSCAMMELGLSPVAGQWDAPPRNPFVLRPSSRDVEVEAYAIKSKYGLDVSLSVQSTAVPVDPKALKWCRTCRHYRRLEEWDNYLTPDYPSAPAPDRLPCKIADQTMDVWQSFFSLDRGQRTWFPNNCHRWERK